MASHPLTLWYAEKQNRLTGSWISAAYFPKVNYVQSFNYIIKGKNILVSLFKNLAWTQQQSRTQSNHHQQSWGVLYSPVRRAERLSLFRLSQGVTKRCRLSWLTNSSLWQDVR